MELNKTKKKKTLHQVLSGNTKAVSPSATNITNHQCCGRTPIKTIPIRIQDFAISDPDPTET